MGKALLILSANNLIRRGLLSLFVTDWRDVKCGIEIVIIFSKFPLLVRKRSAQPVAIFSGNGYR